MYSVHPRPGGSEGGHGDRSSSRRAEGEMLDLWSTFEHWQLCVVCTSTVVISTPWSNHYEMQRYPSFDKSLILYSNSSETSKINPFLPVPLASRGRQHSSLLERGSHYR
jgi:hypothetical protein